MGTAAAMQALKKFTSGGQQQESGGKQDFLSLAMAEASKVCQKPDTILPVTALPQPEG